MRVPYRFVASRLAVVSVIGGTSLGLTTGAMAQEAARLSWEPWDVKDAITDKTTATVVSAVEFSNGTALQTRAQCNEVGIEFAFDMFSGKTPSLLAWKDKMLQMRVRVGGGSARTATAAQEFTNEAKILFYDPDTTRRLLANEVNKPRGDTPMAQAVFGWMARDAMKDAMAKIQEVSPGTIAELASAESVRFELALADGRANVVDLNPRDPALNGIIQQCLANLGRPAQPAGQADPMAPTIPLVQPKKVALTKPINVYLSTGGNSTATMTGEISVLGQKQFSNGYLCVVRGKANGQEVSGFIGLEGLDTALDWTQWRVCRTPRGAGGVEIDDILVTYPFAQPKPVTLKDSIMVYDTEDFKGILRLTGKISVLGQKKFGEKSFYCVVSAKHNGRDVRGLIKIGLLHDSLDASERNACYMPRGAGGIELPQSAAR
jgi:hypothetical protein